jgi:prophage antirepressor-like protein
VVSESGLWQLVLHGAGEFSDRLRYWLVDEVIPAVMRDGYYQASDVDAMVNELREKITALELGLDRPGVHAYGDFVLGDLIGTDIPEENA